MPQVAVASSSGPQRVAQVEDVDRHLEGNASSEPLTYAMHTCMQVIGKKSRMIVIFRGMPARWHIPHSGSTEKGAHALQDVGVYCFPEGCGQ